MSPLVKCRTPRCDSLLADGRPYCRSCVHKRRVEADKVKRLTPEPKERR